ncbi:hypothetical protein ACFQU2_22855 [Siccirubricoccus deserti]
MRRLAADHRRHPGLAAGDAVGGLVQEAHRALATDRAVDQSRRPLAEFPHESFRHIRVGPGDGVHDVQAVQRRE